MQQRDARKTLKQLFPNMEPAQIEVAAEMVEKLNPAAARAVMKTHRINHEFFSFPMFAEAVRTAYARTKAKIDEHRAEKTVAGVRRLGMTEWGIDYTGMADVAVLEHHFKSLAARIPHVTGIDAEHATMFKLYLAARCRQAYEEIGFAKDDAMDMACEVVGAVRSEVWRVTGDLIKAQGNRLPMLAAMLG